MEVFYFILNNFCIFVAQISKFFLTVQYKFFQPVQKYSQDSHFGTTYTQGSHPLRSRPRPDLPQSPFLKVTSSFTDPLNSQSLLSIFLFTFTLKYKLFFVSVIFPTLNQSTQLLSPLPCITTALKFKSFLFSHYFLWIRTEIVPRNFCLLYFLRVVHQYRPVLTSLGSMRTQYNLGYINICLEQQFPTCGS